MSAARQVPSKPDRRSPAREDRGRSRFRPGIPVPTRPALAQESVIRGRFRVSESSLGVGRATIESVVCASIYVRRRAAGLYRMAGVYV